MAKVTIVTVEGEAGELREIVHGLLGSTGLQNLQVESSVPDPASQDEEGWTSEELRTLWNTVSPGVRPIWTEVAKRPEGYSIDELRQQLGMPGAVMSGQLAAVAKALRRLGWSKPDPMGRDLRARKYSMAPNVAQAIHELAREEQS